MKKIILWNSLFLVGTFVFSIYLNGYKTTVQYWMCDYIGYGFILTGQRMLKQKNVKSFPIYIIGLIFNLIFGVMNKSFIHILFCVYSIGIFTDNWNNWVKINK